MDLPIPTHLQPFLTPIGEENGEHEVTGKIHCACGGEQFEVWESNERQIVKLICKQCGREMIILDIGKHGWNGFICKEDFLDRALPYKKFDCPKCGQDAFNVEICISSQGKQDFLDECVSNDDSFSLKDWVDGFEWVRIAVLCANCSFKERDWVDLEAM